MDRIINSGSITHRVAHAVEQHQWRYNGKPYLCRKCGSVLPEDPTLFKCRADVNHACELESVTSAEERQLMEVHRRLKAACDEPLPRATDNHDDKWVSLMGLDRN